METRFRKMYVNKNQKQKATFLDTFLLKCWGARSWQIMSDLGTRRLLSAVHSWCNTRPLFKPTSYFQHITRLLLYISISFSAFSKSFLRGLRSKKTRRWLKWSTTAGCHRSRWNFRWFLEAKARIRELSRIPKVEPPFVLSSNAMRKKQQMENVHLEKKRTSHEGRVGAEGEKKGTYTRRGKGWFSKVRSDSSFWTMPMKQWSRRSCFVDAGRGG